MNQKLKLFWLLYALFFDFVSGLNAACVKMWDAGDSSNSQICDVMTESGENCQFPFSYNNDQYSHCILINNYPQCLVSSGVWSKCIVPTDAIVTQVTTRKAAGWWINGASMNGGTLIWISGDRFASSLFSISPTSASSNQVILVSSFNSYDCQIHPDKTTTTQITCYTSAMPQGKYFVKVIVNNYFIPSYQYVSVDQAYVTVSDSNTPKLNALIPFKSEPGSLITLNGDFKTFCYTRDDVTNSLGANCGDDSQPRITRIYIGGQNCEVFDSNTNQQFANITQNSLTCQANKPEISYFNASLLVTNEYGRSVVSPAAYLVSPDDNLYNFQTFATINSISPQNASTQGGNVQIKGNYFYTDINVPAKIEIGGQPCEIINFDMTNMPVTQFVCKNKPQSPQNQASNEYYGNRGINLIVDSVYTDYANLASAIPSGNATTRIINQAAYMGLPTAAGETIWLKGYINPKKESNYEISLATNGVAQLYVSTDASSTNKLPIASSSSLQGNVQLKANQNYYFELIASIQSGSLNVSVNAKMLQTKLTDSVSSNVLNENQEIEITSTVQFESYTISYSSLPTNSTGESQVQSILINSMGNDAPFILKYGKVTTTKIPVGSSAQIVQTALLDLPNLSPNLVSVSEALAGDGVSIIYNVTFSADFGNVELIEEVSGNVNATITKVTDGLPNGARYQLNIENSTSGFFKLNDTSSNIQSVISQSFGIRCPASVLNSSDTFATIESEYCNWNSNQLNDSAFCGKCSNKNTNNLFWNINSTLAYKYVCYAYKLTKPFNQILFQINDPLTNSLKTITLNVNSIADNQWHYNCSDLSIAIKSSAYSSYPLSSLTVFQAWVSPSVNDMYLDSITIRKTPPLGYDDGLLPTTRRLYPSLQVIYNSLNVITTSSSITIEYRPANCSFNLLPVSITPNDPSITVTQVTAASPPVTGSFNLAWSNTSLDIPANITDSDLAGLFQSIPNFGTAYVTRTKDCAGYKWSTKWRSGGDKNSFIINSDSLSGNNPKVQTKTVQNGGALFSPIQDDMLRTYHKVPQITVSINNINSKCNSSCDFIWSVQDTPVVNSINTNSLSSIQITGSGFDPNPSNNLVLIGNVICNVTSSTETLIVCAAGQNPIGSYNFSVSVSNKGLAIMNSNPTVSFTLTATSLSPAISGTGGGSTLTITGMGFNKDCIVKVDNIDCPIVSVNYSLITCTIPSNPTPTNKIVDVVVSLNSVQSTLSSSFTYDADNTSYVTSISPAVLSVLGGEIIHAVGYNLPVPAQNVLLGKTQVTVLNSSNTDLFFVSPQLKPGIYNLVIPTQNGLGNANVNTKIEYVLYVSSVTPNVGSIRGGTVATVYGDGFSSNCSLNQVTFANQPCRIIDCSTNWIRCRTPNAYIEYNIDNSASDPYYGAGYAWSTPYLSISKGDTVKWTWQPPRGISSVQFQVVQVSDATSQDPLSNGFSSGSPTATGSFKFQFNQAGTFYYWSGFVESSAQITFRGVINVKDSFDKELKVGVKLNGIEAQMCSFPFSYNQNSYNSCITNDFNFNWCSPIPNFSGQTLKCNPLAQPPVDSCPGNLIDLNQLGLTAPTSAYSILFTTGKNQLPVINDITTNNITLASEITIQGSSFSSNSCENQVLIGEVECPIITASPTKIICKLDSNSGLIPNTPYNVELAVKNIGYALKNGTFFISFLPAITSITPTIGSIAGGTRLTIDGSGFLLSSTVIHINNNNHFYNNDGFKTIITYNKISLITNANLNESSQITVTSRNVQAICLAASCTFTFSQQMTPLISSVSPNNVNASSLVTIAGDNFGTNLTNVNVNIGKQNCIPSSVTNQLITCLLNGLNLGNQNVAVNIFGLGNALNDQNLFITGLPLVSSISPSSGSIYGGTLLTILGNGFDETTKIFVDNVKCSINSYSINKLTCITGAHSAGSVGLAISSNNVSYSNNGISFTYDSSISPIINTISPTHGTGNSILQITGSGFGTNSSQASVKVGNQDCLIQSYIDTQINCVLSSNSAGLKSVVLSLNNIGLSNNDKSFQYDLSISTLSKSQGSIGGSLSLKIDGNGFSSNSLVSICGNACSLTQSSFGSLTCSVPPATNKNADTQCDVIVTENGLTDKGSFTYLVSLTPKLLSVSPSRGGTGGGTLIKITGTNFPSNMNSVVVTIAGSQCILTSISSNEINCRTNSYSISSLNGYPVQVFIQDSGIAVNDGSVQFQYIDLWSSPWTWGGQSTPGEGELVVIDRLIYFDTTTPILKGIIIQGGSLIFDDNQDVSLNAEYIIISDAGKLQIGTKEQPFTHKATITMYGSVRSVELPIFGSKVIGLRNGTIDIHGQPVGVTWTYLGATSLPGSNQITLIEPVVWPVGSKIVIATTGDKFSPGESEVKTVVSKSSNNRTLTLDTSLKFKHLSEKRTVGTQKPYDIYLRAEVGLLSRNVVIQGHNDESWAPLLSAPACPAGFDPSEFAVQTCFLGRYGPELGTDQFGAILLISGPMKSNPSGPEAVIARLSNVEFFHVGQAFRLGRYPIHFHMNGDMPSSYVSECSIHESFNRATNIHASNYITIEKNVIYNIMGGAYFLEDGIEIGNIFQYNLAVFVRTSSSLLNEDITPASFWVTNPNNTYLHNAVAGSTHFGWWYRILDRPDGPSFNPNYCPKKIPFGRFFNNSVHSTGRFGLWIFPGYTPTVSGSCFDNRPSVAKFYNLTSWSNDKGAEFVESNNVQFKQFIVWDQYSEGINTMTIKNNQDGNTPYKSTFYSDSIGSSITDSYVIGNSLNNQRSYTPDGVVVAWDRGQLISNVSFYNFPDQNTNVFRPPIITGRCMLGCGGWTTQFKGLYFENVKYRTLHRWNWDAVYQDLDGSLTGGTAGDVVISKENITLFNPSCRDTGQFKNGLVCSNTKTWIRFAYNKHEPKLAVLLNITNSRNQTATSPYLSKRLTHPLGFMVALEANQIYSFIYDEATRPTNISFTGTFYGLKPNDYLILQFPLSKMPDLVQFDSSNPLTQVYSVLSASTNKHGDWFWNNDTFTLSVLMMNDKNTLPFIDYPVVFSAVKCRYARCQPPVDPGYKLPVKSRPADALFWSNLSTWTGYLGGNSQLNGFPKNNDTVLIPDGKYVVLDCPVPYLYSLQIEGVLEFDNNTDHHLEVEFIFINGGQLIVGWEDYPIKTNVEIVLKGRMNSMDFRLPDGLSLIGGKGIGVYGGLDIHGTPRTSWTRLNSTLKKGSNTISLIDRIPDWKVGDQIIITTTSFIANQTEIFFITAISNDFKTLTLNASAQFEHLGWYNTIPTGANIQIAAAVGLLTRNVKIIGDQYPNQEADLYGFRIIVSDYSIIVDDRNVFYKGYARISNVEFNRPGQFSLDAGDDSKYGILFSNLGNYNNSRPSYVRSSSFHQCYTAAIGIFGSNSIPIENNVVYRTISIGLNIQGNSNIIRRNLVAMNYWYGSVRPWHANFDKKYWGAINLVEADSYVLEDNFVAGAERIGIHYRGDLCPGVAMKNAKFNQSVKGNTVIGAMSGIAIFPSSRTVPGDSFLVEMECVRVSGFNIFKSFYWGIYYNSRGSLLVDSNILGDNQVNVWSFVINPSSLDHISANKKVEIKNNVIVGQSPSFNCTTDLKPDDINTNNAGSAVSFGAGRNYSSKIGIVWSNFLNGPNMSPLKPWKGVKTYNQISGIMLVDNVTFAYFDENCNGDYDAMIAGSLGNDDGQHPVKVKNLKLNFVNNASKVWLFRPNIEKINPSDCVDMDCDGQKKNLLTDLDGSLLGSPGHVFSQSEYEWGSQQRGLGDFRIPKEALAAPNGSMLNASQVYKYPGIVRDESLCFYKSDWQAYECHGLEYKMLIIESMDNDTETRRLSPVAILSDNGYLDLINGPEDHGWCFGYTCQKRISTFFALVASNKSYDIYLTSTPPNQLRFRILDADSSFKIRLSMYYSTPQRIDLYKNDTFISPTNADFSTGKFQLKDIGANASAYMPNINSQSGTNFFSSADRKMFFSMDGANYIDLKIAPVLFVRIGVPAITPDEFFNSATLVGNIAHLLGIDSSKIRRVNIVRASSRKRQASSISYIELTIYEDAALSLNDKNKTDTLKNSMNELDAKISNLYLTGQLQAQAQQILNVTLAALSIQSPSANTTAKPLVKIANSVVVVQASDCKAQVPCLTQPSVKIVDENGNVITNTGNSNFPWIIQAKINSSSNPNVSLIFETEVPVINGYANFTKLGVSNVVDNLLISYSFKLPAGLNASSFDPMNMISKPIKAINPELTCSNYGSEILAYENTPFNLTVSIIDKVSKLQIQNINFNNNTWVARISMFSLSYYPAKGSLVLSNSTVIFDTSSGLALFSNLQISKAGMYVLSIQVYTTDNMYSSQCYSNPIQIIQSTTRISYDSSDTPDYIMKFNGSYSSIIPADIKANVYNYMSNYGLTIGGISCYSGSVYVSFYSSDTNVALITSLISSGLIVSKSLSFQSITVGSNTYSCSNCTIVILDTGTTQSSSSSSIAIGVIIGALLGGLIALALLVSGYCFLKKMKNKARTRPVSAAWEEKMKTFNYKRETSTPMSFSLKNKTELENI